MKASFKLCLLALVLWVSPAVHAKGPQSTTDANALAGISELSGTYYILRHGESVPSAEHRVCATLQSGTDPKNGLTPKGREEVVLSTTEWIKANKKKIGGYLQKDKLVVVTSPYSRTKESAEILVEVLQANYKAQLPKKYRKSGLNGIIVVEDDLREREFGKFEGASNSGKIYKQVWEQDRKDPKHHKWGVESASDVQARASHVVAELEKESQAAGGKMFVLVAHGDTLKILQTAFQKQSPAEHCNEASVSPIKTAEIREFKLVGAPASAAK